MRLFLHLFLSASHVTRVQHGATYLGLESIIGLQCVEQFPAMCTLGRFSTLLQRGHCKKFSC